MALNKREIVEIKGIKSYFFPNLALYATSHSDLLLNDPGKANKFATHVLGASTTGFSEEDILEIIVPQNGSAEVIAAGMDVCILLGEQYRPHLYAANEKLASLGRSHDLLPIVDDEEKLMGLARKSKLKKAKDAKILHILLEALQIDDPVQKFRKLNDLCDLDLDFDAYIFYKALGLESPDTAEEFEVVLENVSDAVEEQNPLLKELLVNGPKSVPVVIDEFTQDLLAPITDESICSVVLQIVEKFDNQLKDDSDQSLVTRAKLGFQLYFLLTRTLAADQRELSRMIQSKIPPQIRAEVFPGLQKSVFKSSVFLGHQIIQVFLGSQKSFTDWSYNGLTQDFQCVFRRRAVAELLKKYSVSVTENVFDFAVPLLTQAEADNREIVEKVANGLRFASWLVEFYGAETDTKAMNELAFVDASSRDLLVNSFKKFSQVTDSKDHVARILESLEKSKSVSVVTNDNVKPTTAKGNGVSYTRAEMQNLSLSQGADNKAKVMTGLNNSNSVGLLAEAKESTSLVEIIDETDSTSVLNNTKEIGNGVVVKAQEPVQEKQTDLPVVSSVSNDDQSAPSDNVVVTASFVDREQSPTGWSPAKSVALPPGAAIDEMDDGPAPIEDDVCAEAKTPTPAEKIEILSAPEGRANTAWGAGDVTPIPLATPTNEYKVSGFGGATLAKGFGQFGSTGGGFGGGGGGGYAGGRGGGGRGSYGGGDRGRGGFSGGDRGRGSYGGGGDRGGYAQRGSYGGGGDRGGSRGGYRGGGNF